jgi:cytoplasmic iron level regulating protein YaaA (DUF328/UPF0246 family)
MVSLKEFKTALGSQTEKMSEEQIIKLMDLQKKLASALFDMWRKNLKQNSVQ